MVQGIKIFCGKNFKLLLICIIAALTLLAWSNRFIQDDAFISYRYAYNFAHGDGLVWNIGERVEGYTNFLWTLLMSVPIVLNSNPVTFSFVAGLVFFILCLVFTYKLSCMLFDSQYLSLLVIVFLGTNYTFSSYATGGLETQLQAFLFTAGACIAVQIVHSCMWSRTNLVTLSLLLSAALLTRPDSVILIAGIIPVLLYALNKKEIPLKEKISKITWLLLPAFIIIGSWLVWKSTYYGDLVPNTYYAKVSSATSLTRGLLYLNKFFLCYWLIPFAFMFLFASGTIIKKSKFSLFMIIITLALWFLYIVMVGGDFMEFRFLVPVMPLVFVLIVSLLFFYIQQKEIRSALIVMVLTGSFVHAIDFGKPFIGSDIERIKQLQGHVKNEDENWENIGKVLGELFDTKNVTIATTAAGAIPYYSRLETIDMFGLNDRWIAKHGKIFSTRPGHQRNATLEYLVSRGVNIVIGHPRVRLRNQVTMQAVSFADYFIYDAGQEKSDKIPPTMKILEIPLDEKYKLIALYFVQSDYIDELIQQKKVNVITIQYLSE